MNESVLVLFLLAFTMGSCKKINKSEMAYNHLLEGRYSKAIKNYLTKDSISPLDCYNGLVASIKVNDNSGVNNFSKKLIHYSGDTTSLYKVLNRLGWEAVSTIDLEDFKLFQNNINQTLRERVEELYRSDQFVRTSYGNIEKADSSNLIETLDILNRYGYPDAGQIGVWFRSGYLVGNPINVVILHQLQKGNTDILNVLNSLPKEKQPSAHVLAIWNNYSSQRFVELNCGPWLTDLVQYKDTLYLFKCEDTSICDANRKMLGLDPYMEYNRKTALSYLESFKFYNDYNNIVIMGSFADVETEQNFKNRTKLCNLENDLDIRSF